MRLPHTLQFEDLAVNQALDRLRTDPKTDLELAASDGFDSDDDEFFQSVYEAYDEFYESKKAEVTLVLGKPVFDGHWMDEAYPVWGIAERLTYWKVQGQTICLQIHQEDREIGILVSLMTPESPNANHDPVSVHAENRKFAKMHSGE